MGEAGSGKSVLLSTTPIQTAPALPACMNFPFGMSAEGGKESSLLQGSSLPEACQLWRASQSPAPATASCHALANTLDTTVGEYDNLTYVYLSNKHIQQHNTHTHTHNTATARCGARQPAAAPPRLPGLAPRRPAQPAVLPGSAAATPPAAFSPALPPAPVTRAPCASRPPCAPWRAPPASSCWRSAPPPASPSPPRPCPVPLCSCL